MLTESMKIKIIAIKKLLSDAAAGTDYVCSNLEIKYAGSDNYYIINTTKNHETKELKTYKEMTKILKIVL